MISDRLEDRQIVLERTEARRGYIRAADDGSVVVRMPRGMSEERAMAILRRRWPRLSRELCLVPPGIVCRPERFESGESIRVLDRVYRLQVEPGRGPVKEEEAVLRVFAKTPEQTRARLKEWVKEIVEREARLLAEQYARQLQKPFTSLEVRHYRARLGCCGKGQLRFHWGIGLLPTHLFQTIVAHEVSHLAHPNHQKDFWNTLISLVPESRANHKILRRCGVKLRF